MGSRRTGFALAALALFVVVLVTLPAGVRGPAAVSPNAPVAPPHPHVPTKPGAGSTGGGTGPANPSPAPTALGPVRANQWVDHTLAVRPPATGDVAMATDPANNDTLLFGGQDASAGCLNDTWEWVNGTWSNLSATLSLAPPATCAAALTWDARDGYFLLFGGDPGYGNTADNQTWAYANGSWTNLTNSVSPPSAFAVGLIYDPLDRYVLEFGGIRGGTGSFSSTWRYVAGNWTNLTSSAGTPPAPRGFPGLTYDPIRQEIVLFGGRDYPYAVDYNDTWAFASGSWTELLAGSGYGPSERRVAGLAYEPTYGYDLMFGGEDVNYNQLDDTWIFNGTTWTNVSSLETGPAPSGRFAGGFAYVGASTGVLLFGGCDAYGCTSVTGDEWTFSWNLTVSLLASRTGIELGGSVTLTTNATGGSFLFGYDYNGLPVGCTTVNATSLTCTPTATGRFEPNVTVHSYGGSSANLTVNGPNLTVVTSLTNTPSVSASEIDLGQSVWINSSVSGGEASYTYSYGLLPPGCLSANTSTLRCTPTSPGSYTPTVSVKDAMGSVNTTHLRFTVNPGLAVTLTPGAPRVDLGLNLSLTAAASGGDGTYRFAWSGLPASCGAPTASSIVCATSLLGTVNASVTVEDTLNGTPAVAATVITVVPHPAVSIAASTLAGVAPFSVTFTSNVSGGVAPFAYQWVFGDDLSADAADVSHTYESTGSFTATVWVNDSQGLGAHTSVVVQAVTGWASVLTATAWAAELGQSVVLNDSASGGVPPYTYAWSGLPAGCASANVPLLVCTPSATGTFAVSVAVTDGQNVSISRSHVFTVVAAIGGSAGATVTSACGYPENVTLSAAVHDGEGPYSYSWELPNGAVASTATVQEQFGQAASGPAVFRATDALGGVFSENVTIPSASACSPTSASNTTSLGGGVPTWELAAGAGVVIVVVAAIAGVALSRRRQFPADPATDTGEPSPPQTDE